MSTLEIIGQAFGFLALAATIASFHFKSYRRIVIIQMLSSALLTTHFLLLYSAGRADAVTAGVLNALSFVRNGLLVLTEKRRTGKQTTLIAVIFSVAVVVFGILTWSSWVSALFIIAMVLVTVSMSIPDPNKLRLLMLTVAPFALTYDILIGSIGGSINEVLSFSSALIAFLRNRPARS